MAATVTLLSNPASGRVSIGSRTAILATIAGDASYPTGGYVLTPGQFGLTTINQIYAFSTGGYLAEYVPSTGAIKLSIPGAGSAVFTGSALATHAHANMSIEKELVTVTTNVGTLAAIPASITMIYANTATSVGPKTIIPDGVATAAGQVAVNFATGAMTFFATDAVTQATVTYEPEVAGAGGGKGNQAITAGTPAGSIAFTPASGGEVANGTNLSTLTGIAILVIGD